MKNFYLEKKKMKTGRILITAAAVIAFTVSAYAETVKRITEVVIKTEYGAGIAREASPGSVQVVCDGCEPPAPLRRSYPTLKPRNERTALPVSEKAAERMITSKISRPVMKKASPEIPSEIPEPVSAIEALEIAADLPVENIPSATAPDVAVYFEWSRAYLGPISKKRLLKGLDKNKTYDVYGYTDETGPKDVNDRLALARAGVVARFLKAKGYRIAEVKGQGLCCYKSKVKEERYLNRRVEVKEDLREASANDIPNTTAPDVVVYFEWSRAYLGPISKKRLLKGLDKNTTYDVYGYTDETGPKDVNDTLAFARAGVVARFLKTKGYRIAEVRGHGLCCYKSKAKEERYLNRRVEVKEAAKTFPLDGLGSDATLPIVIRAAMLAQQVITGCIDDACGGDYLNPEGVEEAKADALDKFKSLHSKAPVASFEPGPVPGSYEVIADGNIAYFFPPSYLFLGHIVDGQRNLTEERKREIAAAALKELSYDSAIKIGDGPVKIVEFSDPDCPFCRKVTKWFSEMEPAEAAKITRYVFMFPLPFHKDAPAKAKRILCAKDSEQVKIYEETLFGVYDNEKDISAECEEVASPVLESHIQMGARLGVGGTPAIWVDGEQVGGANFERLGALLAKRGVKSPSSNAAANVAPLPEKITKSDIAAIKNVKGAVKIGNGPVSVIEFSDPDCPFCRKATRWFEDNPEISKKITRLVYFSPIESLHPDAFRKATSVVCSSDPVRAYKKALTGGMDGGTGLPEGCGSDAASIVYEHMKWAQKMGMRGTPHFVIGDRTIQGANMALVEKTINELYELKKNARK